MPRPYVVGWYYAFATLNAWRKRDGWRVMWIRRRMWKQMLKKRYYWKTPDERVEGVKAFIDGLHELGKQIHQIHADAGIKSDDCGYCNPTREDDE